jgi:hypothetical protein
MEETPSKYEGNIFNKQSRTADKGWSSSLGLGVGITTPRHKNKLVTKMFKKPRNWNDFLDKRPKLKKINMRFGTWNVRSMYRAGPLRALAEGISEYI